MFGFGGSLNLDIVLDPTSRKKFWKTKNAQKQKVKLPIYSGDDDLSGVLIVEL